MKRVSFIVSVVLLIVLTAGAQKKSRIADSWIAAWNAHDAEKVIAIFSPDVVYEDVTFGAVNHGSAELRKFAASIFEAVPDAKFELVNSSADRNTEASSGSSVVQTKDSTRQERNSRFEASA